MPDHRRVVITAESSSPVFAGIFAEDVLAELSGLADVVMNDTGRRLTPEELADLASEADAIITTWGTPFIDADVIAKTPRLRFIGHAAGSVKPVAAPEVWDAGITVTNAASAIATYVGEYALLASLAMLRTFPKYVAGNADTWTSLPCDGWETLFGKTVGLIGLGHTAKAFLRCLAPFRCRVLALDPYAKPETAHELGVELVSLEGLLSESKIVSLHAPANEETSKMLNAGNLRLIRDGAVLVNTARGTLIDHDALTDELRSGRFKAFLDVTDPEPLPADHPLRQLPNVVITPHVAGPTTDGRRDMFQCVVDDLKLFWSGQRPKNAVTKEMLATMA